MILGATVFEANSYDGLATLAVTSFNLVGSSRKSRIKFFVLLLCCFKFRLVLILCTLCVLLL